MRSKYYLITLIVRMTKPCIAKSCLNTKNTTDIFDEKIEEITQRAEALGLKTTKIG